MDTEETGRAALAAVCAAWNLGALHWNADALADVYAVDALLFGGRPGHAVGRAAIREYFYSYKDVIRSATLSLVDQHLVALAASAFLCQGYADFLFELADGRSVRSVLRATLVVTREVGRWSIRQHHFSPSPEAPPLGG
ncbi:MAG: nuclear transport factor 2 family protein [Burkholderiales bacterium]|nr:nuclear transport factor 2 family protein [Burkholderiales bacterium]